MNLQRLTLILPAALALLLGACGMEAQDEALAPAVPVEAEFSMEPNEPESGDTVTFAVTVTQAGKPVDDAREVRFEWWKEGDPKHRNVYATFQKDGLYIAKQTVDEPGSYFVYYHVTARDFHTMKKIPFTVKPAADSTEPQTAPGGSPSLPDATSRDAHAGQHGNEPGAHGQAPEHATETGHAGSHGHDHAASPGHAAQVVMHWLPGAEIRASQPTVLKVRLEKGGEALTQAAVRFEYWQEGDAKHQFGQTQESQPGLYEANISFPSPATYSVKVHVEAPGIHDHQTHTLTVR